VELKLNGIHQLLLYADDVILLGNNIYTIKKNTKALNDGEKEVGVELNTEETKYTLTPRHQYAHKYHNIKTANRSFENVAKLKSLGTTVPNQNLIYA
jgi:hypothetical protein